jgi:hypothetical protein
MADLPELSVFTERIYQVETTDPIEGGIDGIANRQIKALANRTRWLKDAVDNSSSTGFFQGELKWLNGKTSGFINTNFPSGVGVGIYSGWAVANGANGTTDMGGRVAVAYGNTFININTTGGAEKHTLSIQEMPIHSHRISAQSNGVDGSGKVAVGNNAREGSDPYTDSSGGGLAHNNMQPFAVVRYFIRSK